MFNAIDTKEEGNAKEEEMKKNWWSINSDNFTLMYGQEMDALANQKISAEEQTEQQDKLKKLKLRKK